MFCAYPLNNIGSILIQLGKYDQAYEYLLRSITIHN